MGLKPKHFFWSMTFMAALMIYTEMHNRFMVEKRPAAPAEQAIPTPSVEGAKVEAQQNKIAANTEALPKRPSRAMTIDGKPYVLIDDRWHPKTEDNVYLIKGEKIYFVDAERTEEHKVLVAQAPLKADMTGDPDDLLNSITSNPLAVQSPANIKKMLDTLGKAKSKVMEREHVLRTLSTAE